MGAESDCVHEQIMIRGRGILSFAECVASTNAEYDLDECRFWGWEIEQAPRLPRAQQSTWDDFGPQT